VKQELSDVKPWRTVFNCLSR